jgi:hypothetical protein
VTKFATLGEFLVCRLSLHRHNIKRYGRRGLEAEVLGYLGAAYIKRFEGAVVDIQKNLQHYKRIDLSRKKNEVIVVIFIIQETSHQEFSGAKQSIPSLKGWSTVHKEVSLRVGVFWGHSRDG